jgi:hypothetical protein
MNATKSDVGKLLRETPLTRLLQRSAEDSVARFREARVSSQKREAQQASRANFFSLFGLERREAVHSILLASLLDPFGTHGQGLLFLNKFLEVAKLPEVPSDLFNRKLTDFWVGKEFPIPEGRLDIIVTCISSRFLLVIENKIDHKEGVRQLDKYREWIDSQRHTYQNANLVFLTPKGHAARTLAEPNYVPLSYEGHIVPWLESCKPSVPPRLRETIDQYLSVIRNVGSGDVMSDYDESLLDFLREPDNFIFFTELRRVFERIEADLKHRFWNSIEKKVRETLRDARNANIRLLSSGAAPAGIRLSYAADPESDNDCFVAFEQQSQSDLLLDVRFVKEVDQTSVAIAEGLDGVRSVLKDRGFTLQQIDKESPKSLWVGWLYLKGYSLNDPAILCRLVDNDGFTTAVSTALVELFEKIGGAVSRLHPG